MLKINIQADPHQCQWNISNNKSISDNVGNYLTQKCAFSENNFSKWLQKSHSLNTSDRS